MHSRQLDEIPKMSSTNFHMGIALQIHRNHSMPISAAVSPQIYGGFSPVLRIMLCTTHLQQNLEIPKKKKKSLYSAFQVHRWSLYTAMYRADT